MKRGTDYKKWNTAGVGGCYGFFPGCLVVIVLLAGCASMFSRADGISSIAGQLAQLRVSQPGPDWNSVIHATEVDVLQPVGDDQVLVGTLGKPGDLLSMSWMEFMLLDKKSGKKIWIYPRSSLGGLSQTVLSVDPVILVKVNYQNESKYCALDQQSGKLLWERKVKPPETSKIAAPEAMIVVTQASKPSLNVFEINLADGKDIWGQEISNYPPQKDESVNFETSGETLIVLGKEIVSLSRKRGAILWRAPFPGAYSNASLFSLQEDGLFLSDGKKICLLNTGSGIVTWETAAEIGAVRHIAPVDKYVFIITRFTEGENSRDTIKALRRETGTEIWSTPISEAIQSPLFAGETGLYFSSRISLYSLDLLTGKVRFAVPIPVPLDGQFSLPDILSEYDEKIIVARESGVVGFSPENGAVLLHERVGGGSQFTYRYSANRNLEVNQVAAGPQKAQQVLAQTRIAQDTWYLRMAQEHRNFVYARTEQVLRPSLTREQRIATRPERMAALRERISASERLSIAREMQAAEMKMEANLALANAIIDASKQIAAAIEEAAFKGLLTNTHRRLSTSILTHSKSLNHEAGLYIRPFYRRGLNLTMVDLRTGKRADIVLVPAMEALRHFSTRTIKMPAFAVDQTGTKLIVKGLALQDSQYETYEMLSPDCDNTGTWNWTIPYSSILSYDIPAIFESVKQAGNTVVQDDAISEKERAMINAAFNGDRETVKKMLEQGANVNAIDEDGHTALMHACLALRPDIVELLLKSGANVDIRDDDCWSAFNYWNWGYLSGKSRSDGGKIVRLLYKAMKK